MYMREDELNILRMYIYTMMIYIVHYTYVRIKDISVLFQRYGNENRAKIANAVQCPGHSLTLSH